MIIFLTQCRHMLWFSISTVPVLRGHSIWFLKKYRTRSLNYPLYSSLSGEWWRCLRHRATTVQFYVYCYMMLKFCQWVYIYGTSIWLSGNFWTLIFIARSDSLKQGSHCSVLSRLCNEIFLLSLNSVWKAIFYELEFSIK